MLQLYFHQECLKSSQVHVEQMLHLFTSFSCQDTVWHMQLLGDLNELTSYSVSGC